MPSFCILWSKLSDSSLNGWQLSCGQAHDWRRLEGLRLQILHTTIYSYEFVNQCHWLSVIFVRFHHSDLNLSKNHHIHILKDTNIWSWREGKLLYLVDNLKLKIIKNFRVGTVLMILHIIEHGLIWQISFKTRLICIIYPIVNTIWVLVSLRLGGTYRYWCTQLKKIVIEYF